MTEPEKHDDSRLRDTEDSDAPEPQQSREDDDSPIATESAHGRAAGRGHGALVWLALLLALASLGLSSYPLWSEWTGGVTREAASPSTDQFESLVDRVEQTRGDNLAAIEAVRAELAELSTEAGESNADMDALDRRIDQIGARLETLEGKQNTELGGVRSRLEELESRVGRRLEQFETRLSNLSPDLDSAEQDLSTRLILMEIDSLFAIAQDQLAVSGEPGSAIAAWQRGMERLGTLNGAEFENLKTSAQREYNRLKEFSPPETGPQVERLYRIAADVSAWPVRAARSEAPVEPTAVGADGWRDRLGNVFDSLVQVETVDSEILRPGEIELVREQVRTTLHTAALALVRSSPELAGRLVDTAAADIQRVFDTETAAVSEALTWLEALPAGDSRLVPPSLTASRVEISRLLGGAR